MKISIKNTAINIFFFLAMTAVVAYGNRHRDLAGFKDIGNLIISGLAAGLIVLNYWLSAKFKMPMKFAFVELVIGLLLMLSIYALFLSEKSSTACLVAISFAFIIVIHLIIYHYFGNRWAQKSTN